MTVQFRPASRDEVPAVLSLLADDVLGRNREGTDLQPYLAAFDAMRAQGGNHVIVGLLEDRIVACYQLVLILGLSAAAALRAQIEGVRVASDLAARASARN